MKRGTPENPKVAHLAELLNIEIYEAVGILEMLWHFTARYAPQGDVGKHSDAAIAKAVGWKKRPGLTRVPTEFMPSSGRVTSELWLSSSLVRAKFLDSCTCHRLVVHDWHEHADQSVTKMLARRRLSFVHPSDILPEPKPEPKPEPDNIPDKNPPKQPEPLKRANDPPGYALDEQYAELRKVYAEWAPHIVEADFKGEAWREWRILDHEQSWKAIQGIKMRRERADDPAFALAPAKYLRGRESEWYRPPRPKPKSAMDRKLEGI